MEKEILTTFDISRYCRVNISTVTNWINDGSLKAYKTKGGHRRVKKTDLLDFSDKYKIPLKIRQKIIIIDDDESIQTGFKEILVSQGYDVEVAGDGFTGAMLVEKYRPDLVILDLIMPSFDGFYFCQCIKKQPYLKNIKIIVLTGYPSEENTRKAKESGVDIIIHKPIDKEQLIDEIRKIAL